MNLFRSILAILFCISGLVSVDTMATSIDPCSTGLLKSAKQNRLLFSSVDSLIRRNSKNSDDLNIGLLKLFKANLSLLIEVEDILVFVDATTEDPLPDLNDNVDLTGVANQGEITKDIMIRLFLKTNFRNHDFFTIRQAAEHFSRTPEANYWIHKFFKSLPEHEISHELTFTVLTSLFDDPESLKGSEVSKLEYSRSIKRISQSAIINQRNTFEQEKLSLKQGNKSWFKGLVSAFSREKPPEAIPVSQRALILETQVNNDQVSSSKTLLSQVNSIKNRTNDSQNERNIEILKLYAKNTQYVTKWIDIQTLTRATFSKPLGPSYLDELDGFIGEDELPSDAIIRNFLEVNFESLNVTVLTRAAQNMSQPDLGNAWILKFFSSLAPSDISLDLTNYILSSLIEDKNGLDQKDRSKMEYVNAIKAISEKALSSQGDFL